MHVYVASITSNAATFTFSFQLIANASGEILIFLMPCKYRCRRVHHTPSLLHHIINVVSYEMKLERDWILLANNKPNSSDKQKNIISFVFVDLHFLRSANSTLIREVPIISRSSYHEHFFYEFNFANSKCYFCRQHSFPFYFNLLWK